MDQLSEVKYIGGRGSLARSCGTQGAMMSKRACVLTSAHESTDVRIFYKECRSLAGAGYEVTLVVPHAKDDFVDGVRIKAVPQLEGRLARMTLTAWRVYREAVRVSADVYHFHDPELIPAGLLLRLRGKKVVYDIHEDLPRTVCYKLYLPTWLRRPVAWVVERLENLACRFFSALVPATPVIAERFWTLNGNTVVIHNYPILQELTSLKRTVWGQRDCSVAYVGAGITTARGIWQMIQAMQFLPDTLPARLELAGPFQPLSLREEVSKLPGWRRVDELGMLDRAGVARVLGRVQAGLVLEHPEPNYIQAKPVKMFEYMCAGIPVIASDFPVWREIIEGAGCGLLVDPLNPLAIAEAIEYILAHPQEAEAMGRRGRAAVEKDYNWEQEEPKLLQLYGCLAGMACLG